MSFWNAHQKINRPPPVSDFGVSIKVPATSTPVIISTKNQTPIASTTVAIVPSETKTYVNTEWGFEFQYPKMWKIQENNGGNPYIKFEVNVKPASGANFSTFYVLVSTLEHADQVVETIKSKDTPTQEVVDGMTVTRHEYIGETHYIDYIIPLSKYAIFIGNENLKNISEFTKILSTFKFLKK